MSEKQLRRNVTRILRDAGLDPVAVENVAHPGTPDVNYADGWIELKQLDTWPVRADTPVRIEHLTAQQRIFLLRRCKEGGAAWLLLQVGGNFLLFEGDLVGPDFGRTLTRDELLHLARKAWIGLEEMKEGLPKCLKKRDLTIRRL